MWQNEAEAENEIKCFSHKASAYNELDKKYHIKVYRITRDDEFAIG